LIFKKWSTLEKGTKMVNYKNGIIYKLCCKDPEITDIYVGSTTNFKRRKNGHKTDKVYKFIRLNGEWENWDMVEVERYEAKDKMDLNKRERYWFEKLKATLNTNFPSRGLQEWIEANKEKISVQRKGFREGNKEKLSKIAKEYYKVNREKLIINMREYRQDNKEKIAISKKEWGGKKVECPCGAVILRSSKTPHLKTIKHTRWLKKEEETLSQ
jgi:predicted GIY-YIG superfamily endonuclease